jgi:hypothetical protein
MLAACVKTLISSFYRADYQESVVGTFFNTIMAPYPWKSVVVPPLNHTLLRYAENITIVPSVADRKEFEYGISNLTAVVTLAIFDDVFPSFLTIATPSAEPFYRFQTAHPTTIYRTLDFNPWAFPNNLTRHFERMAISMTNNIRSSSSSVSHVGMAYERESYVAVHWAWLSLPICLLVLSGIFLSATMIKTSKELAQVGLWKLSATGSLLYGADEREDVGPPQQRG